MKKRASVFLSIIIFSTILIFFASCSQDVNPSGAIDVSNTFGASLKSGKQITVNATYRPEFFSSDSGVFNKELALLSFVGATSMNKQACLSFYNTIGFTRQLPLGWDNEPTADSVAFLFAYKKIDDSEIVAVTVRGFNYDSEWSNNLTIGETGDHEGFSLESEKIFSALEFYINAYVSNPDEMKIWIMGYSRGGAISDMLSHRVLSSGIVDEDNLYAYTFEAPSSLCNEYKYSCVHDIRNSADLIPFIPPADWNLYRAGIETNIYSENIRTYLIEDLGFNEEDFPSFTPSSNYSTPEEFDQYIIGIADTIDLVSSRSQYYDNVQTPASNFSVMLMADGKKGLNALVSYFSQMEYDDLMAFIYDCYTDDMKAYSTFKQVLTDASVVFDDEELKGVSAFITDLVNCNNTMVLLVFAYMNLDNAKHAALSHFPEVTYVALKHYQPN